MVIPIPQSFSATLSGVTSNLKRLWNPSIESTSILNSDLQPTMGKRTEYSNLLVGSPNTQVEQIKDLPVYVY